jgi:hypothetical protein
MKKKIMLIALIMIFSLSLFSYDSKLEEKLFYCIGHFGATFLYQSYLNIGMVSDAWTHSIYTPDDSKALIGGTLAFLETSRKQVKELSDFSIPASDRSTLMEMIAIMDNLKGQAEAMLKYMGNRDPKDLERYEAFRTQAWAQISKLMDIK